MKRMMFAIPAFVVLTTLVSVAQEPANPDNTKQAATQEKQDHKPTSPSKTVTGCLQKGHEAGEFSITGEDGKTWELSSKRVKLEEHVGHQVMVTGSAHRESKAQEKAEEKKEGQMEKAAGKEEYGDLRVTDLKMVSETCNK
jgi:hypothetical protein